MRMPSQAGCRQAGTEALTMLRPRVGRRWLFGFAAEPPFWRSKMRVRTIHFVLAMSVFGALNVPISAFGNPELEACRSTGLMALRERDPFIKDVTLDFDGMTVAKANTKVEDTPIKTIVIGRLYPQLRTWPYTAQIDALCQNGSRIVAPHRGVRGIRLTTGDDGAQAEWCKECNSFKPVRSPIESRL
jgi:hypothetical protein